MCSAVPVTQVIGLKIDAIAKDAPCAALHTEMQKLAVPRLHAAASGRAGLAEAGLAFDRGHRPEQWREELAQGRVIIRRGANIDAGEFRGR
jgi:hypothetical protein